jgi:hypothetical protein
MLNDVVEVSKNEIVKNRIVKNSRYLIFLLFSPSKIRNLRRRYTAKETSVLKMWNPNREIKEKDKREEDEK